MKARSQRCFQGAAGFFPRHPAVVRARCSASPWGQAGIAALLALAVPVPGAFLRLPTKGFGRQALPAPVSRLRTAGGAAAVLFKPSALVPISPAWSRFGGCMRG